MRVNERKAGVFLSYMQMFIGVISMLFYTPVMLRLMGQSEYGIYNLASSVISYLSLFNLGFTSSYMRFYMKYKSENDEDGIKRVNGTFLLIFIGIMLLTFVAGAFITFNAHMFFDKNLTAEELFKTKVVMGIMVFNMGIIFPAYIFSAYLRAHEKYVFQRGMQLIKTIVNPFVMLPVLFLGGKSIGMAIVTAIISIAMEYSFVLYSLFKLKMRFSFKNIRFREIGAVGKFSVFVFLNMMFDHLNSSVDNILLGIYHGTTAVAIYGVAMHLRMYLVTFSTSIQSVFVPEIHKLANAGKNRELTYLFTKVGRIQFFILAMLTIGFVFFGKEFILMWSGREYEEAYLITLILFIIAIPSAIQLIGEEIQRAKNLHHYRTFVYGTVVIANVLISIPLCKQYGILGCTVGTAISTIVGKGICMGFVYHLKLKLDMIFFWKEILKILPGLIIPFVVGLVMMLFAPLDNFATFLCCGMLFVIVYCLSVWFISFNSYEKSLLTGVVKKVLKKK